VAVSLIQADGLHLNAQSPLTQLAADAAVIAFADGLLARALAPFAGDETTLAQALHQSAPKFGRLLAALLALDAEITAVAADELRVLPLPGFLSYRARLPLAQFPPQRLRLPPLNPGGHYALAATPAGNALAVRADIHPQLRVLGHVRVAVGGPDYAPARLRAVEQRLERQTLAEPLLAAALAVAAEALAQPELAQLSRVLQGWLK